MAAKKRKYLSEFAVNLYSSGWLLIPSSQITSDGEMGAEAAATSKNCHIYLICERPAIRFDSNDFSYVDGRIQGSLVYRIQGVEHRKQFNVEFPLADGAVELKLTPYPHREVQTFDANGNLVRYYPASALSIHHWQDNSDDIFRQLKVLYVGQAFGSGNRAAIDRLRSHSTLQRILADASYNSPDSEIMVLMVEYMPYRVITHMNGMEKDAISDHRDTSRFISINNNPLKLGQQISLAEAALIRYFQPQYNKIYKKKFPSRELKVLAQCYEYDFSGLIVEINTDELNFSLFSEVIAPQMHHSANIDLVDYQERKSFFHFWDHDGMPKTVVKTIGSLDTDQD